MPLLPFRARCDLQLFDSVRNGPIVVKTDCTPGECLRHATSIEKMLSRYRTWEEIGGEVGCLEMDDAYVKAMRLVGSEFEIRGEVTFLLAVKDLGQVWSLAQGVFTLVEAATPG